MKVYDTGSISIKQEKKNINYFKSYWESCFLEKVKLESHVKLYTSMKKIPNELKMSM